MVFSSSIFLFIFLPIVLSLYFIADKKCKNVILLLSSIFFYSWGAPKFIFVILGTTFVDYFFVRLLHESETKFKRNLFLALSLSTNLGLLFYFKYCNFFIENINVILGGMGVQEIVWLKLVLPIGISFYTFESLTYVIDVYKRVHAPLKNFWEYQLYIILFPKLIAGPIIRYHDIADQIKDRFINENIENRINGFFRFIIGLSKKILIANVLGQVADSIYALPLEQVNSSAAWVGMLCYVQIYFDFSGYSDMAIGLALLFGFKFPENFNNPYISQSITEFWRRWHISLGAWMKNYLYIPLGGNQVKSQYRLYLNLWLVFLASGLWHGASWNFVLWGAYHGLFLVLERMFLLKVYAKMGKSLSIILCFFIVNVGWIYFRVEDLSVANQIVGKLFNFNFSHIPVRFDYKAMCMLIASLIFVFVWSFSRAELFQKRVLDSFSNRSLVLKCFTCIVLFIICSGYIVASEFNPFIYFRF
ncbi:MAG: MBOAT family protein [Sphingobacteriaceae bacterium]|nr:MBOAT family protein [Sphingobacteriaceae bacterium]